MDALYFPHLSLPASTWVNPALLFFDQLAIIAPEGGTPELHDDRTRELFDLGMARAEHPYGVWGHQDDQAVIAYILGRASNMRHAGDIARIHAGKLAYSPLGTALMDARLLISTGDGWLEGPEWVIAIVMSYLALQISAHSRRPLPLVTNERAASKLMIGSGHEARFMSRRMRAVSQLLPVPPDARAGEIERFRRRHRRELAQFRTYVTALTTRDPMTAQGDDRFEERLSEAERVRDHLLGEMRTFSWRDQAALFSIAALQVGAAQIENSIWTVGAGLIGLGIAGVQTASAARRRVSAADSRLIYSTNVVRQWRPSATGTLC